MEGGERVIIEIWEIMAMSLWTERLISNENGGVHLLL